MKLVSASGMCSFDRSEGSDRDEVGWLGSEAVETVFEAGGSADDHLKVQGQTQETRISQRPLRLYLSVEQTSDLAAHLYAPWHWLEWRRITQSSSFPP